MVQASAKRTMIMDAIKDEANDYVEDGSASRWLQEADPSIAKVGRVVGQCASVHVRLHTAQILAGVNGPLLLALAHRIGYHDSACIDMLRKGARLVLVGPCLCSHTPAACMGC